MKNKKISKFHVSFHFLLPKITLGPWQDVCVCAGGGGGGGCSFVGMATGPKRDVQWAKKMTYSGPKCNVREAEKWSTGQNATLECYTIQLSLHECN